jgi:FlaG/FlaF family flagellin (archaellin)
MKTRNSHKSLRRDTRAVSPAISTVVLTAAGIVMILIAMSYANNMLALKMAQNEFSTNKQFMQTTAQQIDDIAWTVGRTQTVSFSSKYGNVQFQAVALNYSFRLHYNNTDTWENLSISGKTGIILYNMPVGSYSLGNNFFQRLPNNVTSSFLLSGSTAPISQVTCVQKVNMTDGTYSRIVLAPNMRVLTSTVTSQNTSMNYFKFYLPDLENGTNLYRSQSITLTGNGITKVTRSNVDQVIISVSFPKSVAGFNSSFFNFNSNSITLNDSSTPKLPYNSVVEFYVGKVVVAIGQV